MVGLSVMFSKPVISWLMLHVTFSHHIMLRAQPEIKSLRKIGFSGMASSATTVNIGAVRAWPIKNSRDRRNNIRTFEWVGSAEPNSLNLAL